MFARMILATALVAGCAPGQSTFARPPAAATAFDRAASDPKALEIADRVVAAAGGMDKWNGAKQLRWSVSVTTGKDGVPPVTYDQAWDRWNGRHYGRLHTASADIVVMRSVYDAKGTAYAEVGHSKQVIGTADLERAMRAAAERWELDTTLVFLPFLLEAPGTKLELAGEVPGEAGAAPLDDLRVTFDPKDPTRTATYHALVNRTTNQIERVAITKAGQDEKHPLGYTVGTYIDAAGMKLATTYANMGFVGEVITFSNLAAAGEPDDSLFVPSVE